MPTTDNPRLTRVWAVVRRYPAMAIVPAAWLWILTDPVDRTAYAVSRGLLAIAVGLEAAHSRLHR